MYIIQSSVVRVPLLVYTFAFSFLSMSSDVHYSVFCCESSIVSLHFRIFLSFYEFKVKWNQPVFQMDTSIRPFLSDLHQHSHQSLDNPVIPGDVYSFSTWTSVTHKNAKKISKDAQIPMIYLKYRCFCENCFLWLSIPAGHKMCHKTVTCRRKLGCCQNIPVCHKQWRVEMRWAKIPACHKMLVIDVVKTSQFVTNRDVSKCAGLKSQLVIKCWSWPILLTQISYHNPTPLP